MTKFELAGWCLAIGTICLHVALRQPTRSTWSAALVIDAGWLLLYGVLALWGLFVMSVFFVAVHWRNLVTTSSARNGGRS